MSTFCYSFDEGGHRMDLLKPMNDSINYIEENLTETIDYEKAASLAYCSEYHYKRMFSFLAGIPLSEYIRRRRLTLATFELRDSCEKVIDIALKYGYTRSEEHTSELQSRGHLVCRL